MSESKKSKHQLWPKPRANRDAELDEALRELGDEVLKQEIPERLLRVLRTAKDIGHGLEQDGGGKESAQGAGGPPHAREAPDQGTQ